MTDAQIDQWAALLGEDSDPIKEVRRLRARARAWKRAATFWRTWAWVYNWRWAARQWQISRSMRRALSPRPDPKEDGR